ncbi:MAG: thioredoxin [Deltaproteobacteria bacterium]|nr:thioredoxin [Deltaproteobacteria bacterium]
MSEWITEATADTFETLVVEQSRKRPVIVDFWAPWCAPCKALAPLLEAAVEAREGDVGLVKINTDDNQALAMQFEIRGIPALKVFKDGVVTEQLTGAMDEHAIDLLLDRIIPSQAIRALAKARELLAREHAAKVPALLDVLVADPTHQDEALLLIAQAYAIEDNIEAALLTLTSISERALIFGEAEALRVRLLLMQSAQSETLAQCLQAIEANPEHLESRWAAAGHMLHAKDYEGALEQLMAVLQRDRSFQDDGARRGILAIFNALGDDAPLTQSYRRQMQIYL